MATTPTERYAVIFKAFYMDAFVRRRLARVAECSPSADVYLMMDETHHPAGRIDFPNVIRYCEKDLLTLGFAGISKGSLFWYNADYPLYYFQSIYPDYDYIVMIEYDAVPNLDLDMIVGECRRGRLDLVGQPVGKTSEDYWWTSTMLQFYSREVVLPYLICAAVFSAGAVRHLAARRLAQGVAYGRADAASWPIGETFVGTELAVSGHRMRSLSSFGKLTRYDWWPPTHEMELDDLADQIVVHPVLNGPRYRQSLFKGGIVSGFFAIAKFTWPALLRRLRPGPRSGRRSRSATARDHWSGP
jgi:hypothetical protein